MKKVLFLAPNYRYICTTVTGVTKDLIRRKVQFTTNVPVYPDSKKYKDGEELYLRTPEVEVIFNLDDPIAWTLKTFYNIDAVYGKKELIDLLFEKFPEYMIPRKKGSLQRYISEQTKDKEFIDPTAFDIPPKTKYIPEIKNVYFNDPVTIVLWDDGTKTMVRCQDGDFYSAETGLAVCIAKKALGNKGNFNNVFKKWMPIKTEPETMSFEVGFNMQNVMNEVKEAFHNMKGEVNND